MVKNRKWLLARSEIHEQPFVLMDEVTSAIDQAATEKIIDQLLQTDQTILLIAHNFTPKLKAKFDQIIQLKSKKEGTEKLNLKQFVKIHPFRFALFSLGINSSTCYSYFQYLLNSNFNECNLGKKLA